MHESRRTEARRQVWTSAELKIRAAFPEFPDEPYFFPVIIFVLSSVNQFCTTMYRGVDAPGDPAVGARGLSATTAMNRIPSG